MEILCISHFSRRYVGRNISILRTNMPWPHHRSISVASSYASRKIWLSTLIFIEFSLLESKPIDFLILCIEIAILCHPGPAGYRRDRSCAQATVSATRQICRSYWRRTNPGSAVRLLSGHAWYQGRSFVPEAGKVRERSD
jgi:hypothetical protein